MLVHMQFKLEYFSVGFYLIITEKTQTSWDIWLSVKFKAFYSDNPKIVICKVMTTTCQCVIKFNVHLCFISLSQISKQYVFHG